MEIRTAMLADAATIADGKLYVHGGQWDRIWAQALPVTHPAVSIVLVVEVPYHEALTDHRIEVALTLDGRELGPRVEGVFQVGHAPGLAPGASSFVPLVLPFTMLTFEHPARMEWIVRIDEEPLASLPMEIAMTPGQPAQASPSAGT